MECVDAIIPAYLDRKFRKPQSEVWMWFFHKAYRDIPDDGNEISFPGGHFNFLSCKWSKLINRKDVSKVAPFFKNYRFSSFKEVRKIRLSKDAVSLPAHLNGLHVLSCKILHVPLACNFSHIELHVNHKIIDATGRVSFDKTYTQTEWNSGTAELNKKSQFMKDLRKDFRVELIKAFAMHDRENTIRNDLKILANLWW